MKVRGLQKPLFSVVGVLNYCRICQVQTPQYKQAVKSAAIYSVNTHLTKEWRKEFFGLPEIQQLPAGSKIHPKVRDKNRQKFQDVEGNTWIRVGSRRGDMRMKLPAEDGENKIH